MPRSPGGANPAPVGTDFDAPPADLKGRRSLSRTALALVSDNRLARRAATGDPEAFAAIFDRYQADLYRFCVGILREPQDAQDAVQNTMIRAMRALPGERREMQLKPWLYRIAHNEAVELRRRERPAEPLPPMIDEGAGTEERAERDARLETLLGDIADLPERQRAALVMRELNGLAFGEIGQALDTSPGAVRQALYEARRGLSEMELGRHMDCEVAMRQVSDADGRPRRRGVRAHLRGCAGCRRFQAEVRERKGVLASFSPVPVVALAGLLKGAFGASASGGAGAAVGAGAGAGTAAGVGAGTGVGAGAFAGSLGVSGVVKAAAGVLAVLAVGTAAVDHGTLLRRGSHEAPSAQRRQAETSAGDAAARHAASGGGGDGVRGATRALASDRRGSASGRLAGGEAVTPGLDPSSEAVPATSVGASQPSHPTARRTDPTAGGNELADLVETGSRPDVPAAHVPSAADARRTDGEQGGRDEAGAVEQPEPAELPAHPEQSEHLAHAETGKGSEAGNAASAETVTPTAEGTPTATEPSGHPEHPAHPEHPEHPEHPAHPEQSQKDVTPEGNETVEEMATSAASVVEIESEP